MYNNLLESTYTPYIDHVDVSIATTVPRWPMIPLGAVQGCRYQLLYSELLIDRAGIVCMHW